VRTAVIVESVRTASGGGKPGGALPGEDDDAFIWVPVAWASELGTDLETLNTRGGAIALGHAPGFSGTRLIITMLHHEEGHT